MLNFKKFLTEQSNDPAVQAFNAVKRKLGKNIKEESNKKCGYDSKFSGYVIYVNPSLNRAEWLKENVDDLNKGFHSYFITQKHSNSYSSNGYYETLSSKDEGSKHLSNIILKPVGKASKANFTAMITELLPAIMFKYSQKSYYWIDSLLKENFNEFMSGVIPDDENLNTIFNELYEIPENKQIRDNKKQEIENLAQYYLDNFKNIKKNVKWLGYAKLESNEDGLQDRTDVQLNNVNRFSLKSKDEMTTEMHIFFCNTSLLKFCSYALDENNYAALIDRYFANGNPASSWGLLKWTISIFKNDASKLAKFIIGNYTNKLSIRNPEGYNKILITSSSGVRDPILDKDDDISKAINLIERNVKMNCFIKSKEKNKSLSNDINYPSLIFTDLKGNILFKFEISLTEKDEIKKSVPLKFKIIV